MVVAAGRVTASPDVRNWALGLPVQVTLAAGSPGQLLDVKIGGKQLVAFAMARRLVSAAHSLVRLRRIYQALQRVSQQRHRSPPAGPSDHPDSNRNRPGIDPAARRARGCGRLLLWRQHRAVPLEPGPMPIS
jgi:hypothetical protein